MVLLKFFPIAHWLKSYNRDSFACDILAAVIVTIMLIPQSLAYALLAGLPAKAGLYASILPLIVYAVFGSSKTLSVGPVAIASLMTASALANIAQQGSADYLSAAITLAFLSGILLTAMGLLKLGFLGNFLSHPVVSGFITASAVIIALSQLKHILGIPMHGDTLFELFHGLFSHWHSIHFVTMIIGVSVLFFLVWSKKQANQLLIGVGLSSKNASMLSKAAPVVAIFFSILCVYSLQLDETSVAIVGDIPSGLPALTFPNLSIELLRELFVPALLISIIGYVESISVGKTLAAKRQEKVDVNQEFIGLGTANIASAISGAFPVTGGFSRSVVNFDAGAVTQAASIFTAIGIGLASIFLTPVLYFLPKATLAATIIVAVFSLIDLSILKTSWNYSKQDFYAVMVTIVITLALGVEAGVASGVGISILLILYRSSKPHIAEVGLVEGTEHFRNTRRYQVITHPNILMLRVDESLYFANASYLEDCIAELVFKDDHISHVILMCNAMNEIDLSALEVLESLNQQLYAQGVTLHLSEVKGPVIDKLKRTHFLNELSGHVYLTQFDAFSRIKELLNSSS